MLLDNVDVGLLENSKLDLTYTTIELKAHNGYLPPRKKIDKVKITAELWELFFDNLAKIDAHGVFTNIAASPVSITGEAKGTGWTIGQPIMISNKNGANTIVTSIVVKGDGSPLTAGTNYRTYVSDGTN